MIGFEPTIINSFADCPLGPLGHITISNHRQEAVAASLSTFLTVLVRSLDLPEQASEIIVLPPGFEPRLTGSEPVVLPVTPWKSFPARIRT